MGTNASDHVRWSPKPRFVLRNTSVGVMQETPSSWPADLNLDLKGFRYERLTGGMASDPEGAGMAERDALWLVSWLAQDNHFAAQPYEQLAAALRAAGEADKANDVIYAEKERERAGSKGWRAVQLWFLNYVIGYGLGYRSFTSLAWVCALVLFGMFVLKVTGEGRRLGLPFGTAFSLDMLLPGVELRKLHYDMVLQGIARYYFYLHRILGFGLAAIIAAGFTGLAK